MFPLPFHPLLKNNLRIFWLQYPLISDTIQLLIISFPILLCKNKNEDRVNKKLLLLSYQFNLPDYHVTQ